MKEFNIYSLYNPIGHILVGIGLPAYSDYAERVYNLEGVRRATLATVQLRENGVVADQVVSALSQSEFKNPYNGKRSNGMLKQTRSYLRGWVQKNAVPQFSTKF